MIDKMYFKGLLQKDGWHENVEVLTDKNGLITAINPTNAPCVDYAIPGFQNAHSHAFQYAMAGTAENHSDPNDDFWSWRESMYKLAFAVSPDDLERIAAMLYSEMLRHGITHVAEFHYLHHDPKGVQYENLAEMGSRLIAAAAQTGINITLIPIFYQTGGFGIRASEPQRRFLSATAEDYLRLFEATAAACKHYEFARTGIGIHSLRAVNAEDVIKIAENGTKDVPFHIHIAEQVKEVEECVEYLGQRPVEWMNSNIELSDRFNFVHATHSNLNELRQLAESNVNVVICPSTEANLGDGLFPFEAFRVRGGSWSVGTDSHIGLNPFEELRLLDYGQRLISHNRNTFSEGSSHYAVGTAFDAGRKAMGIDEGDFFEISLPFNACLVSSEHPMISSASPENRLNTIVYASDESMQKGSVVNGIRSESSGEIEKTRTAFLDVISDLGNR